MTKISINLVPSAVALHTRDRVNDYEWVAEIGEFSIGETVKKIHSKYADKSAEPAPFVILFRQGEHVGLVLGNMTTSRVDRAGTKIDDTLLFEFGFNQFRDVLFLVADLLDPDTPDIRPYFLSYAEDFFNSRPSRGTPLAFDVSFSHSAIGIPLGGDTTVAFRSTESNRRNISSLLRYGACLSGHQSVFSKTFLLVSVGIEGPESFEELAQSFNQLIALSRSKCIPETGFLSLKKNGIPTRGKFRLVASTFLGLCLITLLIMSPNQLLTNFFGFSNSGRVSENPAKKTADSGMIWRKERILIDEESLFVLTAISLPILGDPFAGLAVFFASSSK